MTRAAERWHRSITVFLYVGIATHSLVGSDLDALKGLAELNPAQRQVVANYIQKTKDQPAS